MPRPLQTAAVRGAILVASNTSDAILDATTRLLVALLDLNGLTPGQVVSAVFTATPDLDADFPAHAARRLGWRDVPLLGAQEMRVPGAPGRVVRVLLTVREVPRGVRLTPAYLDGAAVLRPDLFARRAPAPRELPAPAPAHARATTAAAARRVALIGLGQIGGSLGLALGRAGGWVRVGFDRDRRVLHRARAAGAIDEAAPSLAAACVSADVAVAAVPVDRLPAVLAAMTAALPRGACLLDTGSARAPVTSALERAARAGLRAVGGHPLAGTEGRGFAAARADLFLGETFVLLPVRRTVPPLARALVRAVGGRALVCTPALHDAALARTSHLPWVLARALDDLGAAAHARGLSGPGFRSMTRLAASDPRMALAYAQANARQVAAAWRRLRRAVDARIAALERRARAGA